MKLTNKALIMSVGTGTKASKEAKNSLAHALAHSINTHWPDRVYFIASKESESLLPLIQQKIKAATETIIIEDPDDINQIYEHLSVKFKEIVKGFSAVTVDFTSGTKAMTGALTILASLYEVGNLSYVAGERQGGVVVAGREKLLVINPYNVIIDRKYIEAAALFNRYQFDACVQIIGELEDTIAGLDSASNLMQLKKAALAYAAWDRFDHLQASELLSEIKMPEFAGNKAFLNKLNRGSEKEPFYIADLVNNAKRRGKEGKFDDAVARLYRIIELIGQYRLKAQGIEDTGDVPQESIPQNLQTKFGNRVGKIQIGLEMDYKFLAEYGDELGDKFSKDNELRHVLKKRNDSIFAHGLKPIKRKDYEILLSKAVNFASIAVKNLDKMLAEASLIDWPG